MSTKKHFISFLFWIRYKSDNFLKMKRPHIPRTLRNLILALYDYRCGVCGGNKRLQIHHIDHNPWNNNISNLKPNCAVCHAFVQHPEKAADMLAWTINKFGVEVL